MVEMRSSEDAAGALREVVAVPEASVLEVMRAYAADAADLALNSFGVSLDFSGESVAQVEAILSNYEESLPRGMMARMMSQQPTQEHLWQLGKIWGGYVGEVIRQRWGGTWQTGARPYAGHEIVLHVRGKMLYPPTRVYNRLLHGLEENVWYYYQTLNRDFAGSEKTDDAG